MKNPGVLIAAALLILATAGCSGKMDGIIRRDAKRIDILYTDSRVAVAELVAVLPSGERFSGKSQRLDITAEAMKAKTDSISAHFDDLNTFAGNVKATLIGDGGNLIECRFKLSDLIIGFSSGGIGLCQMSDGRVIDVFF